MLLNYVCFVLSDRILKWSKKDEIYFQVRALTEQQKKSLFDFAQSGFFVLQSCGLNVLQSGKLKINYSPYLLFFPFRDGRAGSHLGSLAPSLKLPTLLPPGWLLPKISPKANFFTVVPLMPGPCCKVLARFLMVF